LRERVRPLAAGWYAGDDVHANYYGPRLDLAPDARQFDLSPAWHCWVGAAPAPELIEQAGGEQIGVHNGRLADRIRRGRGPPTSRTRTANSLRRGSARLPGSARRESRSIATPPRPTSTRPWRRCQAADSLIDFRLASSASPAMAKATGAVTEGS